MKNINIGRASDNDLVLDDQKVSRYHARIYYSAGRWCLVDLQSTHGTTINGDKVEDPIKLRPSDLIKLSSVKIYFDGKRLLSASGKVLVKLDKPSENSRPAYSIIAVAAGILIILGATVFYLTQEKQIAETEAEESSLAKIVFEHATIEYGSGTYTGDLRNGQPHGYGAIVYQVENTTSAFYEVFLPSSERRQKYEGNWQYGYKHGQGKMFFIDGTVVEGYWENGNYTGHEGN